MGRPSGPEVVWSGIDGKGGICGGPGKGFGSLAEVGANGVLVDVIAMRVVVARVFDAAKGETLLPNRHFGFEAEGEASFDELNGLLDGDVRRGREEEMEVVGHQDEGVDLVAVFGAVFVEKLEEEVGVRVGLEEPSAIGGDGGDEEGADFLRGSLHESTLERGVARGKMTLVRELLMWGAFGRGKRRPAAKAASLWALIPWPEGHGFYRRLAARGLIRDHDMRSGNAGAHCF